jgi:hypothetical protein
MAILAITVSALLAGPVASSSAAPAAAVTAARQSSVRPARQPFPGLSATAIKKRSAASVLRAASVHIQGFDVEQGKHYDYDMVITKGGADGTITAPEGRISLIRVGTTLYCAADDAFWAANGIPNGSLTGKWIRVTPDKPVYKKIAPITTLSHWSSVISQLNVSRRVPGPKFGGVPTVELIQPGRRGGVFYVAAVGPAYPRYVKTTDKTAKLAMFDWDKPVTIEAPPADSVIDLP